MLHKDQSEYRKNSQKMAHHKKLIHKEMCFNTVSKFFPTSFLETATEHKNK
jgi:hypothetical protein